MNLPNLITLLRILLVPLTIWLIISRNYAWAFGVFLGAGFSDAIDGFIARRFNLITELGAYLDPLADKALLVSIYVTLGIAKLLPAWLVILVVTRDVLIIGAVLLSWAMGKSLVVKPLYISKANTVAQILLAAFVLGMLGAQLSWPLLSDSLMIIVAIFTVASGLLYIWDWINYMNNTMEEPMK